MSLISFATPLSRGRRSRRNRLAVQRARQLRYDRPTIGASSREPVNQLGPGIVGDSGERSDAYPVYEIESNFDVPMALPFVDDLGVNDGDAHAR